VSDLLGKEAESFSTADLEQRRLEIRRGLKRANTAAVVILLVVLGLSLAAMVFFGLTPFPFRGQFEIPA